MRWILCSFLVLFLLSACSKDDEKQSILQMLNDYYNAMLVEDLDQTMSYIHPENPEFYKIYQEEQSVFRQFNYRYTVKKVEFINVSDMDATVKVLLNTSGVEEDTDKTDNFDILYTYNLKKDSDGKWKIFSQEANQVGS